MTNTQNMPAMKSRVDAAASASNPQGSSLDTEALLRDLLERAADAQLALMNAQTRRDRRDTDEALLRLRAAAMLIASIPAPDLDLRRFAVIAAALLAAEDDDESSHARLMVEHAIGLSESAALRMSTPSTSGDKQD